jgi:hypothetical protein
VNPFKDFGKRMEAFLKKEAEKPRKEYTDYRMCFGLYKEQIEEANAWREQHEKDKHAGKTPYAGAIGGAYGWKFIGTGLGEIAIFYCMCGEEVNVTDFDNW